MSKRDVEAFGSDDSSLTPGAVTSGQVPKRGKQSDATPSKNDEPSNRSHRVLRAWGYLPTSKMGGLQQDSGRGDKASRQFASPGAVGRDLGGVNSSGATLKPVDPYFADNFQGRSGQPDNQSINRGKGRT